MIHDTVTIHVRMDARIFRRFGFFDTLVLRRRWLSPAVFSAIFIVFSVICFCLTDKAQSALLGAVLLAVGLLLPACYFLNFFLQMNDQVRRLGIKKPKPVYTLTLDRSNPEAVILAASSRGSALSRTAATCHSPAARRSGMLVEILPSWLR